MPIPALLITTPMLAMLLLWGCDFPGGTKEDPPELQTRILEVRVEPNPVAVGDTALFTVIIEDSLDERFEFRWYIEEPGVKVTAEPQLSWIANKDPGTYSFSVRADNGNNSFPFFPPSKGFFVTVVENEQ